MIQLRLVQSPWWALLCVALALAAAWWMYRRTRVQIHPAWKLVLRSLRFVAVFVALFLLLQPLLTATFEEEQPPIVAVVLDDSESIRAGADSAFVRREWPQALQQARQRLEEAGVKLHWYAFGARLNDLPGPDSLRYAQSQSNPGQALQELNTRMANQNLAAVLVATDGVLTQGADPSLVAENWPVPVYAALLGDSTPLRDLRLENLLHNELSYINTQTPVQVDVVGTGLESTTASLRLMQGGRVLASQNVVLGAANGFRSRVSFNVRLTSPGLQAYELQLDALPGETVVQNNRRLFFINVLETKLKLALLAGGPHPDVAAWQRALGNDPRYGLSTYIRLTDQRFDNDPATANWGEFDVLLLHNFPATAADRNLLQTVVQKAKDRVGLAVLAGTGTQWALLPEAWRNRLPVGTDRVATSASEALVVPAVGWRNHTALRSLDFDEMNDYLAKCPPLLRPDAPWKLRPGAELLAQASIKNVVLDYPTLALAETDAGKSLVWVGENIWRYRLQAWLDAESFERFDELWQSLVQWLSLREDKRRFRVFPSQNLYAGGEAPSLRGQAYDQLFRPLPGVQIAVKLTSPEGRQFDYQLEEAQPGVYGLKLNDLGEGTYSYRAEGRLNGQLLGTDAGQFSVGRSVVEFQQLQAQPQVLRRLATQTGGHMAMARNLEALVQRLLNDPGLKPVLFTRRQTRGMHQLVWPLLVLLVALGAEWLLRRRLGLT